MFTRFLSATRVGLSIVIFAICSNGQDAPFPEGVSQKYDRFRDSTTITFRLQLEGTALDGLMLEAEYAYPGKTPTSNSLLRVNLVAMSPLGKTDLYPNREDMLILLLDGRRERFPLIISTDFVAGLRMKVMVSSEFKDFLMPIANAKAVEGKVGVVEFELKPTQLEMLRGFIAKHRSEFKIRDYSLPK